GSLIHCAANVRIFSLVVFPHNAKIDVFRFLVLKGTVHALKEFYGPQVDILAKGSADRDEQAPQGHVIWHFRGSDSPKIDRIEASEDFQPVLWHHLSLGQVMFAAPRKKFPLKLNTESFTCRFKDTNAFRYDLLADPIPWNYRNPVHVILPRNFLY